MTIIQQALDQTQENLDSSGEKLDFVRSLAELARLTTDIQTQAKANAVTATLELRVAGLGLFKALFEQAERAPGQAVAVPFADIEAFASAVIASQSADKAAIALH